MTITTLQKSNKQIQKRKEAIEINGEQTIEDVFKEIKTKLNKIKGI